MPFTPNVNLSLLKKLLAAQEQPGGFIVSDLILPVLELGLLAGADKLAVGRTATFAVTTGQTITVIVGSDYLLVHSLTSVTDILDADQSITLQGFLFGPDPLSTQNFGTPVVVGNSEQGGFGEIFSPPILLTPGTAIGVRVVGFVGGAAGTIAVDVAIRRVLIKA